MRARTYTQNLKGLSGRERKKMFKFKCHLHELVTLRAKILFQENVMWHIQSNVHGMAWHGMVSFICIIYILRTWCDVGSMAVQ